MNKTVKIVLIGLVVVAIAYAGYRYYKSKQVAIPANLPATDKK